MEAFKIAEQDFGSACRRCAGFFLWSVERGKILNAGRQVYGRVVGCEGFLK